MEVIQKRKYTFTKLSENSLQALINSKEKQKEAAKIKWTTIKTNNKMICKVCDCEKELIHYSKINDKRHTIEYESWSSECKECERTRKNNEICKRAENNGLEYNIQKILIDIKTRATKFKRDFDLDMPFLIELFNTQKGVCLYSGKQMVFNINSRERLSLDRIDSSLGYIKTNVAWCCWQANNIKQSLSIEDLKKWISDIHTIINQNPGSRIL